jgi:hypothetical protein
MIHPVDLQPTNTPGISLMQFTVTDSVGDYKILVLLINMQIDCMVPHVRLTVHSHMNIFTTYLTSDPAVASETSILVNI